MNPEDKIELIYNHISNVQRNCFRLGLKMIKRGEIDFGGTLIAHGQIHDNSKFTGIEFEHLFHGDTLLSDTVKHHAATNPHHPEYWKGIQHMPDIYLAEMACDITARAQEFGTDVRSWVKDVATVKYGFRIEDRVGVKLLEYINELLSQNFK